MSDHDTRERERELDGLLAQNELDDQDQLAEVFAQHLSEDEDGDIADLDAEAMSISFDKIPAITRQLGIYSYYYEANDGGRKDLKRLLDPDNTGRVEFTTFLEQVPSIISEVVQHGSLDAPESNGLEELDQVAEELNTEHGMYMGMDIESDEDENENEDEDEDMGGGFMADEDNNDINLEVPEKPLDPESPKPVKITVPEEQPSSAVNRRRQRKQNPESQSEPTEYSFDNLSSYQQQLIAEDLKLFTQGEDRPITIKDLVRVARLVDGQVIDGEEFYSDDETNEKTSENAKESELIQQKGVSQRAPPRLAELIDMLQLHAPGNESDKTEVTVEDFGNILNMAKLL